MQLLKISLVNFRNHEKLGMEFGKKVVIVGPNGSGKSNLLEAIYLLATGRSFRADKEEEMIRYGEKFSVLNAQCSGIDLKVTLTDGSVGVTRKKFEVNGVTRRMTDAVGQLRAVLFGPADLELVTGNPSGRRRYLDFVISQSDREYRRCQISYEKGLRQRNKLLDFIRDGTASRSQLFFWDKLLIKNGEYLTRKREEYLEYINDQNSKSKIPNPKQISNSNFQNFKILYDKSVISEARLKQYENEEVAAGSTLVGPHRDDFIISQIINTSSPNPSPTLGEGSWRDVSKYGSRGEQRMAVLWLKQGELGYLTRDVQPPLLLLDDIFSELDHNHRQEIEMEIENLITDGGQVIMTTADEHLVPKDGWNIIKLPI